MSSAKGENTTKGPATILVVEDEVLVRHDISEYLREKGYNVIEANSATEALQVFRNGMDVALVFNVPVLITSGHVPPQEIPGSLGTLIPKPYERERVLKLIEAHLNETSY
jgi:hypothetical protein